MLCPLGTDLQPLNHGLNSAWRHEDEIEDDRGSSWKRLRSSQWLARDDHDRSIL